MLPQNYFVFDTETGGLDPSRHALLTLGMVAIRDGEKVGRRYLQVHPENLEVLPSALEKNGIDMAAHLEVAIPRAQAAREIKRFCREHFGALYRKTKPVPVAHNLRFDLGMLYALWNEFEMDEPYSLFGIDTTTFATPLVQMGVLPIDALKNAKLDAFMAHYGIVMPPGSLRHNAMDDADATADVFLRMVADLRAAGLNWAFDGTRMGCHCDLEPDMEPDGCCLDVGRPEDCVPARSGEVTCKTQCPHWRPYTPKPRRTP